MARKATSTTEDEEMIHLGTVMRALGERKTFIQNHPEFLEFLLRIFGGELETGTVLELRVIKPGQKSGTELSRVQLEETDMEFFHGVRELVKEIVKE